MKKASIINVATSWVTETTPLRLPEAWYCHTRDIFQVRLQSFLSHVQKIIREDAYLLTAIVGEIGNNSYDHNLGNWRDIPGAFFANDMGKRLVVLADRGQGIRRTISRVMPDIKDDQEALKVAFTEILSGRQPERRGNGLKFVVQVLKKHQWSLEFQSGRAILTINTEGVMQIRQDIIHIYGCLAKLNY